MKHCDNESDFLKINSKHLFNVTKKRLEQCPSRNTSSKSTFLYPLKTLESQRFSNVFRGHRNVDFERVFGRLVHGIFLVSFLLTLNRYLPIRVS